MSKRGIISPQAIVQDLASKNGQYCEIFTECVDLNNPQASSCGRGYTQIGFDDAGCGSKSCVSFDLPSCFRQMHQDWYHSLIHSIAENLFAVPSTRRPQTASGEAANQVIVKPNVLLARSTFKVTVPLGGVGFWMTGIRTNVVAVTRSSVAKPIIGTNWIRAVRWPIGKHGFAEIETQKHILLTHCYSGGSCVSGYDTVYSLYDSSGKCGFFFQHKSYCCPSDTNRFTDCHWVRGSKGLDCSQPVCEKDEIALARDQFGDSLIGGCSCKCICLNMSLRAATTPWIPALVTDFDQIFRGQTTGQLLQTVFSSAKTHNLQCRFMLHGSRLLPSVWRGWRTSKYL